VKWDPESEVILEKFTDWWGWKEVGYPLASPNAPDVFIVKIIKDAVTQERMLRAGQIDIAEYVPPETVGDFEKDPNYIVVKTPSFQNLILLFNTKKPPLDNPLVRQAIAHAIPYEDIVKVARAGLARVASGVIPYGMWGHFENFRYEYNLTLARQLLAEAGYPAGINKTLVLVYTAGDIYEQRTSELIHSSLAQLGITVEIRPLSWEEQWALAQKGWEDPNAAQDLFIFYWWPDVLSPITYLYNMFHSESKAFNLCYYENKEFDNLIMEAYSLEGANPDKALELYRRAQEILYRDVPGVGLWDMVDFRVARSKIGNLDKAINPAIPTAILAQALDVRG
jgi:peptide/nickel transport system substrate-binding protein